MRAVQRLDALIYERIDAPGRRRLRARRAALGTPRGRVPADPGGAARPARHAARRRPRDHGGGAQLGARAARAPPRRARAPARGRRRLPGRRRSRRCCACGRCSRSPARKTLVPFEVAGWTLPPGVHVTPCIYLTHRRADLWEEPTAFRPERFLDGAPGPYAFIPFGGGTRRCLGAAFATLEMREVLQSGRRALRARPGPSRGRAHAPPIDHADTGAGRVRGTARASVFRLTPCRCSAATIA